jgi:hypothetical protein
MMTCRRLLTLTTSRRESRRTQSKAEPVAMLSPAAASSSRAYDNSIRSPIALFAVVLFVTSAGVCFGVEVKLTIRRIATCGKEGFAIPLGIPSPREAPVRQEVSNACHDGAVVVQ